MSGTPSSCLRVAEIRFRTETGLKEDASRLFLRQVATRNGLQFEVKTPNAVTRTAMEKADIHEPPLFESVQEFFYDLEKNG